MCGQEADQKRLLRANARAESRKFNQEHPAHSQSVIQRLESFPIFAEAQTILVYVSLPWELDTHKLIERTIKRGRNVLAPKAASGHTLQWSRIESLDDLVRGKFGISEPPPDADLAQVPDDAVALVPGLLFDRAGNRLGHGKGYYDRFLAGFKGISIGLTYDSRLKDVLPHEQHDRPVDYVVTETEIVANDRTR